MSYLSHIRALNTWDPGHFRPWWVDGQAVGMLRHGFAEHLRRWPQVFLVGAEEVQMAHGLSGFEARSQALEAVLRDLVEEGSVSHFHGELYPVTGGERGQALCVIDRAAAPYFGIRAFGQHMNGFVRRPDGLQMWIARRSADRRQFPDKLDNLVAGGLPHALGFGENLAKECREEAGIGPDLAARARPVGVLSYVRETGKGLKPDTLYCYDLELPPEFEPRCSDGEVQEFYLWPIERVAQIVRESDEFKPNCSLVVIDFLIRHGLIGPEHADYLQLNQGLRPAPHLVFSGTETKNDLSGL